MPDAEKKRRNYLLYDFVKITAAPLGLLWLRPKMLYENGAAKKKLRGGVLLVANHAGFFDPVYLMIAIWYRRHHFVCIKDFFENRVSRFFFTAFHCIPIDRENFSMDSLRMIQEELQSGRLVSMFPEGHINAEGGIAPFKSGMVLIALQSGRPIVPVYLKKPRHWYNRLRVAVGEPIFVREKLGPRPSLSQIDGLAKLLWEKEETLRRLCEKGRPEKNEED